MGLGGFGCNLHVGWGMCRKSGDRPFSKLGRWVAFLRSGFSDPVTDLTRENSHNNGPPFTPSLSRSTPKDQVSGSPSNHSFHDLERGLAPSARHIRTKLLTRDTELSWPWGEPRTQPLEWPILKMGRARKEPVRDWVG